MLATGWGMVVANISKQECEGWSVRKNRLTGIETWHECTAFMNSLRSLEQAAPTFFSRGDKKHWNFVIKNTLHFDKDGQVSDKEGLQKQENESTFSRFTYHDIEDCLDQKTKGMMNRNRGFKFIVRHNTDSGFGSLTCLKNDIGSAIRRARETGCKTEDVIVEVNIWW